MVVRPLDKPAGMGIMVLERKYEKHVCHPMSYQLAKTVTWQSGGFCQIAPLDKPGEMGIIVNRRGRCDKRSAPCVRDFYLGLMTNKNRHLSEWRFLSFNFITRIETEYRPM